MTEQTITAITAALRETPRQTAQELGTTTVRMDELEAAGVVKRAGNRVTGKRGRPPVEWVTADTEVEDAVSSPKLVSALAEKATPERKAANRCKCDFSEVHTLADLTAMGGGCTMPKYGCPVLDSVRRAAHESTKVEVEA